MSTDEIVLGIDLGTTFSVAAYVDDDGRLQLIRTADGNKTTPSAVLIEDGQFQVGSVAINQAIAKRDNVIQWIKRSMGDLDYRFQGHDPIEISAAILRKIKVDAETELGVPIQQTVITCPAYFSAIEVENTMKAGAAAGFTVKEIVREPTAAAVYYGVEHLAEEDKLLVCDLGGGTYDATLLTLEDGVFRPLATAGDRQLGGHDWTDDLLDHVAELLAEQFGEDPRTDAATEQTLYDACEQVKRSFARLEEGIVPCIFKGQAGEVTISRDDFEQMTEWRVEQVLHWTAQVLTKPDPPLTWEDIDHVLLVGGSTRLRRIPEALAELTGQKPIQTAEADTMVALGAAILGKGAFRPRRPPASSGIKRNVTSGLTLINYARIAERNLGTRVIVRNGPAAEIKNSVIIPYGTQLPVQQTRQDYKTAVANQPSFDVPVVEFDDIGADSIQATWRFDCPAGLPQGTVIHVTFAYDQSGQIDVTAVEQQDQTTLAKSRVPYEEPDLDDLFVAPPRCVVFALDVSGSMVAQGKIGRAKQAVVENARELFQRGGGQTKVGVVAFGSKAEVICPMTGDLQQVQTAVSLANPYGSTAMAAGIQLAQKMLAEAGSQTVCEIVLVSDGMPDKAEAALTAGAATQSAGIKLSLLGLGEQAINAAFLQDLTPHHLVISATDDISQSMTNLLELNTPAPVQRAGIAHLKT